LYLSIKPPSIISSSRSIKDAKRQLFFQFLLLSLAGEYAYHIKKASEHRSI
jgi:hypothetical protein